MYVALIQKCCMLWYCIKLYSRCPTVLDCSIQYTTCLGLFNSPLIGPPVWTVAVIIWGLYSHYQLYSLAPTPPSTSFLHCPFSHMWLYGEIKSATALYWYILNGIGHFFVLFWNLYYCTVHPVNFQKNSTTHFGQRSVTLSGASLKKTRLVELSLCGLRLIDVIS